MTPQEREARLAEIREGLKFSEDFETFPKPTIQFLLAELDRVRIEARAEALEDAAEMVERGFTTNFPKPVNIMAEVVAREIRALAARKAADNTCPHKEAGYTPCVLDRGHSGKHRNGDHTWPKAADKDGG